MGPEGPQLGPKLRHCKYSKFHKPAPDSDLAPAKPRMCCSVDKPQPPFADRQTPPLVTGARIVGQLCPADELHRIPPSFIRLIGGPVQNVVTWQRQENNTLSSSKTPSGRKDQATTSDTLLTAQFWTSHVRSRLADPHRWQHHFRHRPPGCGPLLRLLLICWGWHVQSPFYICHL